MPNYRSFTINYLSLGWMIFPCLCFLVPNVTQLKNGFYLFVLVPWLLLLPSLIKENRLWRNPALIVSLLLLIYLAISSTWAGSVTNELGFYVKQVVYLVCYLSAGMYLAKYARFDLNKTLLYACYGAAICLLISTLMYFTQEPPHGLTKLGLPNRFWGYGMVENSLALAQFFGSICLIASYLIFEKQFSNKPLLRVFLFALAVASFCAVMATMSRGASVFLIVSLALMLLHYSRFNTTMLRLTIGFIAVSVFLVLVIMVSEDFRNALFTEKRDLFSIDRRMDIWNLVIANIQESPMFGVGARKNLDLDVGYLVFHHSHSTILETLMYGGVVALLLWGLQIFILAKVAFKHPLFLSWLVFGFLCLAINGHYLLSRPGWQWILYWIPVALLLANSVEHYVKGQTIHEEPNHQ